jgi:Galactose oxidase, central domain
MKNPILLLISLSTLCEFLSACGSGNSAPPLPLPTVTITASDTAIDVGNSLTLNWSSTNATSCTASATPSESDWSGNQPTKGSQSVQAAAAGVVSYALSCAGPGGSASQPASVTWTTRQLAISSGPPPNGTVGSAYNARFYCFRTHGDWCEIGEGRGGLELDATGGTGPYIWSWAAASGSTVPLGLSITTVTYHRLGYHDTLVPYQVTAIAGVPSAAGTYNVILSVKDSASPPMQVGVPCTISVKDPPPPVISTSPAPPVGAKDLPYSFTFNSGSGFRPLTWNQTGVLPTGVTLNSDGVLSGSPTATGSFPIAVNVHDSLGQTATPQDFTILVVAHGFKATGGMIGARSNHTATLLASGKVLVAGGHDPADGNTLASAELYDPASGTFSTTGSLGNARQGHTATLLSSGKVLMTGGLDSNQNVCATTELYDPTNGTFSTTGSLGSARQGHTATLLSSGKVLITGGLDVDVRPVTTVELYDPETGSFSPAGSLGNALTVVTATLLNSGKAIITGFLDTGTALIPVAELYDPASGSFSPTGSPETTLLIAAATLLNNGKVLIAGGLSFNGAAASSELYDPAIGIFSSTRDMTAARYSNSATLLSDGRVLMAGGIDASGETTSTAEFYDPATGSFSVTGNMAVPRDGHTATLLQDGRVLVAGGADASAELYQ